MPGDEHSEAALAKAQRFQQDALWQPRRWEREYWAFPLPAFYTLPSFFFLPGSSGLGSASSIQAAVRQLEAEADAIIQMVREGQRARRQQQAATVSMMPVAPHSFVSPLPHHIISGVSLPLTLYAFALSMLYECFWATGLLSVGVFSTVCWLFWIDNDLKLGHHTPLPAIQSTVALLQTA